jgi:hypothetical protein
LGEDEVIQYLDEHAQVYVKKNSCSKIIASPRKFCRKKREKKNNGFRVLGICVGRIKFEQ